VEGVAVFIPLWANGKHRVSLDSRHEKIQQIDRYLVVFQVSDRSKQIEWERYDYLGSGRKRPTAIYVQTTIR